MHDPDGPTLAAITAQLHALWLRLGLGAPELFREPVGRFQATGGYPKWASHPGVYMFVENGRVHYVGRALRSTLGSRLRSQCNSYGDPRWDPVISSSSVYVVVAPLPHEEWYWAASIEAALIASHRPPHSRRVS